MPTPMLGTSPAPRASPCVWKADMSALPGEGRVEGDRRGREVGLAQEADGVRRAPLAVHARVLPLDRERAVVADAVQDAEERLEVDVAVAGRDEGPPTVSLAEVDVRAEDRPAPVEHDLRV